MTAAFDVETNLELTESGIAQDYSSYGGYDAFFEEMDYEALDVDPQIPTDAKPGSDDKVLMLTARYAAGLPLWHNSDRYDHGPSDEVDLDE